MPTCEFLVRGVVAFVPGNGKLDVLIPDGRLPRIATTTNLDLTNKVFTKMHTACVGFDRLYGWESNESGAFKPLDPPVIYEAGTGGAQRVLTYLAGQFVQIETDVVMPTPLVWGFDSTHIPPINGTLDSGYLGPTPSKFPFARVEFTTGTVREAKSTAEGWDLRAPDSGAGSASYADRAFAVVVAVPFDNEIKLKVTAFGGGTFMYRSQKAVDQRVDVLHLEMTSIVGFPAPYEVPSLAPDRDFELLYDFCKPGATIRVPHPETEVPSEAGGGDAGRCMGGRFAG